MGNICTCTSLTATDTIIQPINATHIDIAHYEQLKVLGRGGQGLVCVCRNKDNNDIVAIKSVGKHNLLKHNTYLHTLLNERNTLIQNTTFASIQHNSNNNDSDNINKQTNDSNNYNNNTTHIATTSKKKYTRPHFLCTLYTAFQSDTHLYLVMPYLSGGDLRYHLNEKHVLDEKTVKYYAAELLISLHQLHTHNVLYRDLKPENILLDKYGYSVLCDYGLSTELKQDTNYTTFGQCGTIGYLSPELLCNIQYSYEIDYWCYGVVLYELLHGKRPIRNTIIHEWNNKYKFSNNTLLHEIYHNINYDDNSNNILYNTFIKPIAYRRDLSNNCIDLLQGLLQPHCDYRYGIGQYCTAYNNGWHSLMSHPWFSSINWNLLNSRYSKPPIKPKTNEINASMKFELEYQLNQGSHSEQITIDSNKQKHFRKWDYNNQLNNNNNDNIIDNTKHNVLAEHSVIANNNHQQRHNDEDSITSEPLQLARNSTQYSITDKLKMSLSNKISPVIDNYNTDQHYHNKATSVDTISHQLIEDNVKARTSHDSMNNISHDIIDNKSPTVTTLIESNDKQLKITLEEVDSINDSNSNDIYDHANINKHNIEYNHNRSMYNQQHMYSQNIVA